MNHWLSTYKLELEIKASWRYVTLYQAHRGSQSGWEERGDESFQARAEEPLGTDSC